MAKSTSETGHVKNLSVFNEMIAFVKTYKEYNPSTPALKVDELVKKYEAANLVLQQVNTTAALLNETIRTRMLTYEHVDQTGTSVVAMLESSEANKEMMKDARGLNRKLHGNRAGEIVVAAEPVEGQTAEDLLPTNISVSQQSYVKLADNLGLMRDLVAMHPGYQPNEAELNVAGLTKFVDELTGLNEKVATEYAEVTAKRNERDEIFYKVPGGLKAVFDGVKKYVLGKYKSNSPEYKQLTKLQMKNLKKKPRTKQSSK
ncbi:MAG: hypothetical protein JNM88_10280, partial [Chitinophagaceae bacterium]|nr:hypothetical protein [Chitinophagaceae bacterium]